MPEAHSEAEVVAIIERIFNDTLSISPPAPEVDIIEAALLDSLGLVTLLFEIEQELSVQMPLDTLEVDDFRSIGQIARLVIQTRAGDLNGEEGEGDGSRNADPQQAPGI
jgi:D-alanine--poly(phosphoribitol) ligase subunit 2